MNLYQTTGAILNAWTGSVAAAVVAGLDRIVSPRVVRLIEADDGGFTVEAPAKADNIQIVMFTDHRGPKPDTWQGIRDGVLFIPGSEDEDHALRFPKPGDDLRFWSHVEETPDAIVTELRLPEGMPDSVRTRVVALFAG